MPAHQAALEQNAGARHHWGARAGGLPKEPTVVTGAEIDALYESTLKPRLEALEAMRLALRGYIVKAGLCVGVPVALFFLSDILAAWRRRWAPARSRWPASGSSSSASSSPPSTYLLPGASAYMNYRTRFKHEVAAEVFRIVCPTAEYSPTKGVAEAVFDEPGIFNTRGGYVADDRVRGTIGRHGVRGRRRHPAPTAPAAARTAPDGDRLPRAVLPSRLQQAAERHDHRAAGRRIAEPPSAAAPGLTRVTLEKSGLRRGVRGLRHRRGRGPLHPDRGDDRADPDRWRRAPARPIYLGLQGHARLSRRALRAGRCSSRASPSTTSAEAIHEMAALFALAEGVVEELDLNTRIWTKDADESLLHAPDAAHRGRSRPAGRERQRDGRRRSGRRRRKAVGDADDGAELAPRPPETSIEVEHVAAAPRSCATACRPGSSSHWRCR